MINPRIEQSEHSFASNYHQTATTTGRTVMINGITSSVGLAIAQKAIAQGCQVHGYARNPVKATQLLTAKKLPLQNIIVHSAPPAQAGTPEFWEVEMNKLLPDLVVNTVGTEYARNVDELKQANTASVQAPAEAFAKVQDRIPGKGQFVQISTLATRIPELVEPTSEYTSLYAQTKEAGNRALETSGVVNKLIIDASLIVSGYTEINGTSVVEDSHAFSASQFSALPWPLRVHPILGSGMQPVQPYCLPDLVDTVLNAQNINARVIGVSKNRMTQESFMRFFADLRGVSFHPWYIPLEAAQTMGGHFPKGFFTGDNAKALTVFERHHDLFFNAAEAEVVMGREAMTMEELYHPTGHPIVFTRPPVLEFAQQVGVTLWNSRAARADTWHVLHDHGTSLVRGYLRA